MSTIIKSGTTKQLPSGAAIRTSALQLTDFSGRAEQYVQSVQNRAAQIVQEAHRKSEQICKQAEENGRQAAMQAAQQVLDQKVARQMETLLPALRKAIVDIEDAKQEWLRFWERSAVKLATAIAARVIRREVRHDPSISMELIREALQLASGAGEIKLHLHPSDHQSLAGNVEPLAQEFAKLAPSDVIADEEVSVGGCRLTTQFGEIDQQIEAQLARIEEELAGDE